MTGGILHPLRGNQREAVAPGQDIWLSASAGTGKTQVLTARVFRLLLNGSAPENLLCLTFTKAGAAEMANRINARLAAWVRMKPEALANDLKAIGAPFGPNDQARARRLFAKVLDAPAGGLRIQTIHSFCQSLLAAFPAEAGLVPGFVPLEERDQAQLRRDVLADLVSDAAGDGRAWLIAAIQTLSIRLGEQGAESFLVRCASAPDAMAQVPGNFDGALVFARRIAGVEIAGDPDTWLAEQCGDAMVDLELLRSIRAYNAVWKAATGTTNVETIDRWLALKPAQRAASLADLNSVWATQKGELTKRAPKADGYAEAAQSMLGWCAHLQSQAGLAHFANIYGGALLAGKTYLDSYQLAKRRRAVVDFDDLIRRAAALLKQPGIGNWIRFKLDARIDHVLVDEAQDTNRAQWDIIEAVTEDFFAGAGAQGDKVRTVFTVGDFKQAIFGFQGTDPEQYRAARERLHDRIEQAFAAPDLDDVKPRKLARFDLATSFRSTEPILKLVDALVAERTFGAFGLEAPVAPHVGVKPDIGEVVLLRPVRPVDTSASDEDEESWIAEEQLNYARRLARQIRDWIAEERVLDTTGKPLEAGDIMILVRRRSELAALLVARLYAEGVPVAGVDRLRLGQPLAVKDLLAAIRFAVQPEDDLNLAELLVSPLMAWTQERLLDGAYRGGETRGFSLWRHLREQPNLAGAILPLRALLARAEYGTPHEFLEHILSGNMDGRRKLVSRLGQEALDPIGELINAAFLFEQNHNASLQGFLHWFDRGDVDVKREQTGTSGEVRVMTVHGSKGLQAPLVILADTTADPTRTPDRSFDLRLDDTDLPVLALRKEEKAGRLAEAAAMAEARDLEEHWRLLYVAMTRAEERLVLAGSLGVSAKGPPEHSWYAALDRAMASIGDGMGCEWEEHEEWGAVRRFAGSNVAKEKPADKKDSPPPIAVPDWLRAPAPIEARPPRPLAPSSGGEDDAAAAPPDPKLRAAAERGRLLHGLFEHLPGAAPDQRRDLGLAWFHRRAPELDDEARTELIERAALVLDDPRWSAIFAPDALAEAPIAAVVGESVIAGTVDRLLIAPDRILVVDFKTGANVPTDAASVPLSYQRQMARYVAALGSIFPDRPVQAALLYSHAPRLIELTAEQLEENSPA